MDDKSKSALMIGLIACSWVVVIMMLLTGYNYWISLPLGLIAGGIAFAARNALG